MKINTLLKSKTSLIIFLCLFLIYSTKSNKNNQNFKIRPNVADLTTHYQKIVRPLIDAPFIPTEVESLVEKTKKTSEDVPMTSALLVGPQEKSNGLNEKPIMYSTVIDRHPTIIRHQIPQPKTVGIHPDAAKAFAVNQREINEELRMSEKMKGGAYSIPIKIESAANSDPSLSSYETPNFIHKKENVMKTNDIVTEDKTIIDPETFLKNNFNDDVNRFISQLENTKDKEERINALREGKKKLDEDILNISQNISKEIKELLLAKEIALKLSNLNNYYATKIKKDELSSLKLSDIITIKNSLRDKIHKEIQGFRTAPIDYDIINKVNPVDIEIIMKNIKLNLGN